jgi:hypothetical protein
VQEPRGHHHAGVDRGAYVAPDGIPGLVVEPVPELLKAIVGEVLGGAVVEPGVKL